jgi:hypothetical protein
MKVHTMFVIGKCDIKGNAVSVQFTAEAISARNRATKRLPT